MLGKEDMVRQSSQSYILLSTIHFVIKNSERLSGRLIKKARHVTKGEGVTLEPLRRSTACKYWGILVKIEIASSFDGPFPSKYSYGVTMFSL